MSSSEPERRFLHDISNPLTVACGHAKLIAKKLGELPADADLTPLKIAEKVEKIRISADRMMKMCDERIGEL